MKNNIVDDGCIPKNDVAALLVKLYADYQHYYGSENADYAKAVGIAIRMLRDEDY